MTPDDLRSLADALEPMARAPRFDGLPVAEFCAWLRQCAEQRLVAYKHTESDGSVAHFALYAEPMPPQREPLSNDWIIDTANEIHRALPVNADEQVELLQIVRAVERAHGIGGSDER